VKSNIEIARSASKRTIIKLAEEWANIPPEALEPYGHFKAKLSLEYAAALPTNPTEN